MFLKFAECVFKKGLIVLAIVVAMTTGCAPSLSNTMRVDVIPPPEAATPRTFASTVKIHVERFADSRESDAVAEINGRKVGPDNDVGQIVQQALEQNFRARGAIVSIFEAPATVSGEVTTWKIHVKPGFPTSMIEGESAIRVKVANEKGEIVYQGEYSGSTSLEHPFPREGAIESVLGGAMRHAIDEVLSDKNLISALEVATR